VLQHGALADRSLVGDAPRSIDGGSASTCKRATRVALPVASAKSRLSIAWK
jgi:hypothetical protein